MEKGQFSIEFIIVLGVFLTLLASISLPLYENSSTEAQKLTKLSQVRQAANKLADALNTAYAGGIGTKQTVEYTLPSDVLQIRIDESVDGADGVPQNNRMDIQIEMNWEGDNIVLADTLIPSQYIENWQGVPIIESYLSEDLGDHTVTVTYENHPTIVLEEA